MVATYRSRVGVTGVAKPVNGSPDFHSYGGAFPPYQEPVGRLYQQNGY